ncbi:MAG: A/G-specific adenine glycosylase, partial [Rickettsiales bacterium]|nr:A/G-specific adenine glycosylase [Rickettsiales bacterium]
AVYVSEIMLQQTQVQTVLTRFYTPFLRGFPTLEALAAAPEEAVLSVWQGLGYYQRARNLHRAARQLVAQAKGNACLPDSVEALMTLPGVGRNTAHAIAALAFRQPVAVMEANVRRVVARVFALATATDAVFFETAESLLDHNDPFTHNQAMMDIGAMVCTAKAPACDQCPLSIVCQGKTSPECYPEKKVKSTVPVRRQAIIVFENGQGEWYLQPRETRLLGGLYGFIEQTPGATLYFQNQCYRVEEMVACGQVTHTYSHFRLETEVYYCQTNHPEGEGWFSQEQMNNLPLSTLDRKVIQQLSTRNRESTISKCTIS